MDLKFVVFGPHFLLKRKEISIYRGPPLFCLRREGFNVYGQYVV